MSSERRRQRVEDVVLLAVERISKSEIEDRFEDFGSNEHVFSIHSNDHFEIERYLTDKLIGNKMDQAMAQRSIKPSARGFVKYDDQLAEPGTPVELKLKLLPSGLGLVIIARIVTFESNQDYDQDRNNNSLDFNHLHEADRKIQVQHVHGKQMESLSNARVI